MIETALKAPSVLDEFTNKQDSGSRLDNGTSRALGKSNRGVCIADHKASFARPLDVQMPQQESCDRTTAGLVACRSLPRCPMPRRLIEHDRPDLFTFSDAKRDDAGEHITERVLVRTSTHAHATSH
jgi:hypothetical protein